MSKVLLAIGWMLRASAAICIVWTASQVLGGRIDTVTVLLGSVAWHAAMAMAGVALVGSTRGGHRVVEPTA